MIACEDGRSRIYVNLVGDSDTIQAIYAALNDLDRRAAERGRDPIVEGFEDMT